MAKATANEILQGDRIQHFTGAKGTITAIRKGLLKYGITWDNGKTDDYTSKELAKWCKVLPPEPKPEDIEEKRLNLWEQLGDNDPPDFSREKAWEIGDRVRVTNPNTPESVTAYEWIVDGFVTASSLTRDLDLIIIKRFTDDKGSFTTRSFEPQWLCKISEPVDSSRVKEDSVEQLNLLAGLTGESPSRMTKMRSQSSKATLTMKSLGETSENSTQARENMTSLLEDSPAQTPAEPETELELLTYLQSLEQCSENSSELLEKPDPSLSFWNSLPDLSIEDLERGLEDCEWVDIKASIQYFRQQINLERSLRGSDYLSFPTLLSGRGRGCRDAGLVECEKWWKQREIVPLGYQLSAPAIALLHGFPSNWYGKISPRYQSPIGIQVELQPVSLEVKPSPSPKPESLLSGLSGSGQSLTDSGLVISFGKTYPQLLNGKSATRRLWKFSHAQKFIRAYQKGLRVQAIDKDQRYGGKQVGWLTLLEEPYEQPLSQMPLEDLAAEGFPELTLTEFCDRFFEGNLELTPWVIRFRFEPLEVERLGEQPDDSLEKSRPQGLCEECGCNFNLPVPQDWNWVNGCYNCFLFKQPDITDSLEKPEIQPSKQTGSLYQYTANRTGKDGVRREYPIVEGRDRDKANDDDWYWGISYVEKVRSKWCDRSSSIPRASLPLARAMMRAGFTVETTIEAAQLKFCWLDFRETWAIGEVRPEACPRLAIISFEEKQILVIPSNQWGELKPAVRIRLSAVIRGAIAEGKSLEYVRGLL